MDFFEEHKERKKIKTLSLHLVEIQCTETEPLHSKDNDENRTKVSFLHHELDRSLCTDRLHDLSRLRSPSEIRRKDRTRNHSHALNGNLSRTLLGKVAHKFR